METTKKLWFKKGMVYIESTEGNIYQSYSIMDGVYDFIYETEQEFGKKLSDKEWLNCVNDYLTNWCIGSNIKYLGVLN
jgi:hypothetical protein